MDIKRLIIVAMGLSVFLSANVKNLTLYKALKILNKNNLELKVSRFNEQMKAYEVKAVKGMKYGNLDATIIGMRSNDSGNVFGFKLESREASFGDFGFSEFDMSGRTNPLPVQPKSLNYPEARNHYQTRVRYMLPLYVGGKLKEYARITKSMQIMSQLSTDKLLSEKIFQTKKAFYDISLISNYIRNLSKIIKNISRLETIVNTMYKEGYAQNIDILEVQARKSEVQNMYNQAKLNSDLAYQFLSFILNKKVTSIKKVNDMAKMPRIDKKALLRNNIDIKKARLGAKISKMAINAEKANFLPTVGAFAEYGSSDDTFMNAFTDKDSYSAGVQLKWNIFNGGIDKINLEKAKVNALKTQSQVALAKKGILLKVKKLRTEIMSAKADIRSYEKQLKFAKKLFHNYSGRYKEGMVSISDLLIKQSKEIEMLMKVLTAKNQRNTKVFELNSILNNGVSI